MHHTRARSEGLSLVRSEGCAMALVRRSGERRRDGRRAEQEGREDGGRRGRELRTHGGREKKTQS